MIKRTIVLSNQAYLKKENDQLVIEQGEESKTIPIEDIAVLMLESHQCTITQAVLSALMANNAAVISCDATHHPDGLMLSYAGNVLHTAILRNQLAASIPLRKQLWQQTMKAKIQNQSAVLALEGVNTKPMDYWQRKVRSGDPDNYEGRAAAHYWKHFFPGDYAFVREPEGLQPNRLLNYGYAIIRAAMARAIVSSGLHPAIGLHHKSQYNPFCLADDLMEPYRPFLDIIVKKICVEHGQSVEMSPSIKKALLGVLSVDVWIENERKPLLLGLTSTSASLVKCYDKEEKKITYPLIYAPE